MPRKTVTVTCLKEGCTKQTRSMYGLCQHHYLLAYQKLQRDNARNKTNNWIPFLKHDEIEKNTL